MTVTGNSNPSPYDQEGARGDTGGDEDPGLRARLALQRFQHAVAPMMQQAAIITEKVPPQPLPPPSHQPIMVSPPLSPPPRFPSLENTGDLSQLRRQPRDAQRLSPERPSTPWQLQVRPELPAAPMLPDLPAAGKVGQNLQQGQHLRAPDTVEAQVSALTEQLKNGQGSTRREALLALGQLGEAVKSCRCAPEVADLLAELAIDGREPPHVRKEAYLVLGLLMSTDDPEKLNREFFEAILEGKEVRINKLIPRIDLNHTFTVWWKYDALDNQVCVQLPPKERTQDRTKDRTQDLSRVTSSPSTPGSARSARSIKTSRTKDFVTRRPGQDLVGQSSRCFDNCSWLVVAILAGHENLVKLLLNKRVDPRVEYSCNTGMKHLPWQGNACFAACAIGNLKLLKMLLEHDPGLIQSQSLLDASAGGDLLWESSYHGRCDCVEHLLLCDMDPTQSVNSPDGPLMVKCRDNKNVSHTAVHVAALGGSERHRRVMEVLIANNADLEVDNGAGVSPLEDAIVLGHANIVQLLVENDLLFPSYEDFPEPQASAMRTRSVNMLFKLNNPLVIAAAAKGLLGASESQVKKLQDPEYNKCGCNDVFVKFLTAAGDAPVYIMEAIFRKRNLVYVQLAEEDNDIKRYILETAVIPYKFSPEQWTELNVTEAPERLQERLMNEKETAKMLPCLNDLSGKRRIKEDSLYQAFRGFIGFKAPQLNEVDVYECILHNIHKDSAVLVALSLTSNNAVFSGLGCQAIVQRFWNEVRKAHYASLIVHSLILFLFFQVSWILNRPNSAAFHDEDTKQELTISVTVMGLIWLISIALEMREGLGFIVSQKAHIYFSNPFNYVDLALICINGQVIFRLWTRTQHDTPQFRTILGVCIIFRWLKVITELRTLDGTGTKILPIFQALWGTKAFILLLILIALGITHMFYSLNIHAPVKAFMIIWRLLFLGDFDVNEMEDENGTALQTDNDIEFIDPTPSYDLIFYFVRTTLLVGGLLFTVMLMNIYIAVLSEEYAKTSAKTHESFTHERMKVVLQDKLVQIAWQKMREKKSIVQDEVIAISSDDHSKTRRGVQRSAPKKHIWFCAQKDLGVNGEMLAPEAVSSEARSEDALCGLCKTVIENMSEALICPRCGRIVCNACGCRAPGCDEDLRPVGSQDAQVLREVDAYRDHKVCKGCHGQLQHSFNEAQAQKALKNELNMLREAQTEMMKTLGEIQIATCHTQNPLALHGSAPPGGGATGTAPPAPSRPPPTTSATGWAPSAPPPAVVAYNAAAAAAHAAGTPVPPVPHAVASWYSTEFTKSQPASASKAPLPAAAVPPAPKQPPSCAGANGAGTSAPGPKAQQPRPLATPESAQRAMAGQIPAQPRSPAPAAKAPVQLASAPPPASAFSQAVAPPPPLPPPSSAPTAEVIPVAAAAPAAAATAAPAAVAVAAATAAPVAVAPPAPSDAVAASAPAEAAAAAAAAAERVEATAEVQP